MGGSGSEGREYSPGPALYFASPGGHGAWGDPRTTLAIVVHETPAGFPSSAECGIMQRMRLRDRLLRRRPRGDFRVSEGSFAHLLTLEDLASHPTARAALAEVARRQPPDPFGWTVYERLPDGSYRHVASGWGPYCVGDL